MTSLNLKSATSAIQTFYMMFLTMVLLIWMIALQTHQDHQKTEVLTVKISLFIRLVHLI